MDRTKRTITSEPTYAERTIAINVINYVLDTVTVADNGKSEKAWKGLRDVLQAANTLEERKGTKGEQLPWWVDKNCSVCGGSGYTSLGGCYMCQKKI